MSRPRATPELLRRIDPNFVIPANSRSLKSQKAQLRQRVAYEVEHLFLLQLLEKSQGRVAEAARLASINRTYLHRLMKRHGLAD